MSMKEHAIIERYIKTETNDKGELKKISFINDDDFNFSFDIVDELAKKCPDKLGLLHISDTKEETRLTFSQLSSLSSKAANYFESLGIKKGDRVMVVLKRHYEFWITVLALNKIGAIFCPTTNLLVEEDFEYRFKAANIDHIISTSDNKMPEIIDKANEVYNKLVNRVVVGKYVEGWHNFNDEYKNFSDEYICKGEKPAGNDLMFLLFTSGTSAYPKIVRHSNKYPLGHYITAKYWQKVNPDGLHLTVSDTGWAKALWGKIFGQWLCEAPIFVYDFNKFDPNEILLMIQKYKITTFCAPPTLYRYLIKMDLKKYDISSLENVTVGGEALNHEVFDKFYEETGLKLMEGYGQSETTLVCGNPYWVEPKVGSMGKISPLYDVHLLDADGNEVSQGEVGEVCINTEVIPNGLFLGYDNDEEMNKKIWHDNFYHTRDLAYMDEDGYLWYVGRSDDMIKTAGYRVGPLEIENVIMKLPYVLECAVTAIPDKSRGQAIKAFIVLVDGEEPTRELNKKVLVYLRENLASYKWPKCIEFVKELPKTISGKIIKKKL